MKNKDKIIPLILQLLSYEDEITEELIDTYIISQARVLNLSEEDIIDVRKTIHSKVSVKMEHSAFIKDSKHKSWYYAAKAGIEGHYWDRYHTYLFNKVGGEVVNSIDKTTDDIMDLIGNPKDNDDFLKFRCGLVIGDVQSGKTTTYTALINKAADAGYKVIVLLTGTIEKLRRQTQGRLDEGFVGLDSTAFTKDNGTVFVGVGNIDPSISAWAVTSTTSDFNTSTANKLTGRLSDIKVPILFVLKKNKSVLEKLEQWLRVYNATSSDKKIHLPLLLIDDEADNASVNTKVDEDPTVINSNIRKILKLFAKANYIGFTATPYANIFINPDSETEMLNDDLFPKNFIIALEPPTNYIGARNIYSENGKHRGFLKDNSDCEEYLPLKHKKFTHIDELPPSMVEAIYSFFISNAIRDLRGDITSHRSMLINVSRFIDVQNDLSNEVDEFVRSIQRSIRSSYKKGIDGLKNFDLNQAKEIYTKYYQYSGHNWSEIQDILGESIASIIVRTINSRNAASTLNYEDFNDTGLRLIAVGGLSLSRGLTLEGLTISYFYRNSQMYDTLMQMGRWFGYRDGYADLCQIWMTEDMINWYDYISTASDELRREIRRMQNENRTPEDFGLCVRSDISTLIVTARNKMKTAKEYEMTITVSGKMIETPYLSSDINTIKQNRITVDAFFRKLLKGGYKVENDPKLVLKSPQFLNVDKSYIIDFLRDFQTHSYNFHFNPENIISYMLNKEYENLSKWDVVIAQGQSGRSLLIENIEINPVQRKFINKEEIKAVQLSGTKSRLGSTNYAKGGLTQELVKVIEKRIKALYEVNEEKAFKENDYFSSGVMRNPLLVIYPVELKTVAFKDEELDPRKIKLANELGSPIYGVSIGIPSSNELPNVTYRYKINKVKYRELFETNDNLDDIFEEDENLEEGLL